jgi:hypothetical protein
MSLNKFLEDNCIPCYEESEDSDADEKTDVDKFVEQHIRNGRIWQCKAEWLFCFPFTVLLLNFKKIKFILLMFRLLINLLSGL